MVFIAFEGGDGAGKSTQTEALAGWLRERGREVVLTREPGGTPLGATIRELLLHGEDVAPRAEALLFAADRAHHVETLIRPALAQGADVLTDRYIDSSVAYQGAGRDLDPDDIRSLSMWATRSLVPDLTVVLDVTARVAAARLTRRGGARADRMEAESVAFHDRVRAHFLALAAAAPERYLVIDAAADKATNIARVREAVAAVLDRPVER